ncbi:MAG TPA: hypothetical protein VFT59_04280 [Candidatus Saccharimonadales bacterium]|nr:hypothetical protein [Candidatus Saccharimonadales bacterium]
MTHPIRPEEIIGALRLDSVYGNPERIEQVKDLAIRLPEILNNRLDQLVTPQSFFQARYDVIRQALDTGLTYNYQVFYDVLETLAYWIQNPSEAFNQAGTTEDEYLLSDHVDFTEPLKQLYREGRLTFADVIRQQPGQFLL